MISLQQENKYKYQSPFARAADRKQRYRQEYKNSRKQSYKVDYNKQPYNLVSDQIIESSYSNNNFQKQIFHDNNLDYIIQDISPRNPFLPREEIIVATPSRRDSSNFNNLYEYSMLNQSLDHKDQAKLNRAFAMGWLPKNMAESMRKNKSKQQLYREELEKQILEKEIEKQNKLEKIKYEEEKYERAFKLNSPKNLYTSPAILPTVKEYPDKRLLSKTPSKLRRTPPNSFRKDNINLAYSKHENHIKQNVFDRNNRSHNNILTQSPQFPPSPLFKYQQYSLTPQNNIKTSLNQSPVSQNKNVMKIKVQPDFSSLSQETFLLSHNYMEPQIQSFAQMSLNFMKRQMQESYINSSKQLDELKFEMEKIKESKEKAQQEFNQLRNNIRDQIQHHNIKLYGGINYIKNPSKFYSKENLLTNNESFQNPFLIDTVSDQNSLQYSQSILSSGFRQSAVQSPKQQNFIKNVQQLKSPVLKAKDELGSKINIEQDTFKKEQILNDSQLTKISQQSIIKDTPILSKLSQNKSDNKLEQANNSDVQKQQKNEHLQIVNEIDLAQSTISINQSLLNDQPVQKEDTKQNENEIQQIKENSVKKEESQSNFVIKKVQTQAKPSLEVHKDMQLEAHRRQQLNEQKNQYNSSNRKQEGEKEFKVLIRNIEEIVEEQGKEISQTNKQQRKQMKQSIDFAKNKKQQK